MLKIEPSLFSHSNNKLMQFQENEFYHIYNRGNNKQVVFLKDENYLFFLKKVRKYIIPFCDLINYCLMPNHFHFFICTNSNSIKCKLIGGVKKNVLSEGFRILLSTYSQAIN